MADKQPRSPFRMFENQVRQASRAFAETPDAGAASGNFIAADSRSLPLSDNSVDLIVTSPPYANALDYMRAHKFSLVWLGQRVGELGNLRGRYIGAERQDTGEAIPLPKMPASYCHSFRSGPAQIPRPLPLPAGDAAGHYGDAPGGAARAGGHHRSGPLNHAGQRVATQEYLAGIAEQEGFEVVGVPERALDRDRRMMPARWSNGHASGNEGIESRLHEEFILGLFKR